MTEGDDEQDGQENWRAFRGQAAFVIVIILVTLFIFGSLITGGAGIIGRLLDYL